MTTKQHTGVASALPDDFVAGGLADDFDGIIREVRYCVWDYQGKVDPPVLASRLKIERTDLPADAEEEEKWVIHYASAGSLEFFRPAQTLDEGETAEEGWFAKQVGKREQLTNNTNWAQFLRSVVDAQFPRNKFAADVRFLEGVKGHFNRLPKDKKGGEFKPRDGQENKKPSDVLCITRFDGFVDGTTASKPNGQAGKPTSAPQVAASTSATSTPATPASGGSIDAKLIDIVKAVVKPGADPIKKTALSGEVLKRMKGDKDVNAAVKRVTTTEFLSNLTDHMILFDADAGTVQNLGE